MWHKSNDLDESLYSESSQQKVLEYWYFYVITSFLLGLAEHWVLMDEKDILGHLITLICLIF